MSATITIPDDLFRDLERAADARGLPVPVFVEAELRRSLAGPPKGRSPASLAVDGDGLNPELTSGEWEPIRDLIYEGRGA